MSTHSNYGIFKITSGFSLAVRSVHSVRSPK